MCLAIVERNSTRSLGKNERIRAIFPRVFNACWTCVRWGVFLALLCAVAGGYYVYYRLDDQIRSTIQKKFSDHYVGLNVHVRSARRLGEQGIEIRGVSIVDPSVQGPDAELVYIDEISLTCSTKLQDLAQQNLSTSQIIVRRPTLNAVRAADGSWNLERLWPLPKFGDDTPVLSIEAGTLVIADPSSGHAATYSINNAKLTLTPQLESDRDPSQKPQLLIEGDMAGDHFGRLQFTTKFDPNTNQWAAKGKLDDLRVSPDFFAALPGGIVNDLVSTTQIRGNATTTFAASGGANLAASKFDIATMFSGGRIDDPRLPHPLVDVNADIHVDQTGLDIRRCDAISNDARIQLTLRRHGHAAGSMMNLWASATDFVLDQEVVRVLPPAAIEQWKKYRLVGSLDAELALAFDGTNWKPDVIVKCRDASLEYYKFPYPLEHATGSISLHDDLLTIQLAGNAGHSPVTIKGEIDRPNATGWVEVQTEQPVRLDETLHRSLKTHFAKGEEFLSSLRPAGSIMLKARFDREGPTAEQFHKRIQIQLADCSIAYEKFPYPLRKIAGRIDITDDHWQFSGLEGRNDSGYVTAKGSFDAVPDGGLVSLDFVCRDVPLEDELRLALSPQVQRVWSDLRPRGSIDHMAIAVRFDIAQRDLSVAVDAEKWPAQQNIEGRSVSIQPTFFPYHMDQVTGRFRYKDGHVELVGMRARHGHVNLEAKGICDTRKDGSWRFRLESVSADRVRIDDEALNALPRSLSDAITKLEIRGPVNLLGSFEFASANVDGSKRLDASWDLVADLENGSMNAGVPLTNIHGGVRLTGQSNGGKFYSRGELLVDSVLYRGIQFTKVRGPLWIDSSGLTFGGWVPAAKPGALARRVTALVLGGVGQADGRVLQKTSHPFLLQANLTGADLKRAVGEIAGRNRNIAGKVNASCRLEGNAQGTHTLRGTGQMQLRNADVYQLPVMVSLLKVLSVKQPDATAFTSSEIKYRIKGRYITVDPVIFRGDAISLIGKGEVSLDRGLKMSFYTMVGRDEFHIPLIRPIVGAASQQALQINLGGTLDNPQVTTNVLPGINEMIKQLFPEELRGNSLQLTPPLPRLGELPQILPK